MVNWLVHLLHRVLSVHGVPRLRMILLLHHWMDHVVCFVHAAIQGVGPSRFRLLVIHVLGICVHLALCPAHVLLVASKGS